MSYFNSQNPEKQTAQFSNLSRSLSHALRHEPWLYELELDAEGWATTDAVVVALRNEKHEWADLSADDLAEMIAASDKQRHEMRDGKIRALYGHSIAGKLAKCPARPPDLLFHGTSPAFVSAVLSSGLLPMARQYVHVSADVDTAMAVGKRKASNPTILQIEAKQAYESGVKFYIGNEKVWLADNVPPEFVVQWGE